MTLSPLRKGGGSSGWRPAYATFLQVKLWIAVPLLALGLASCGAAGKDMNAKVEPLEVAVWMPTTWDYADALGALKANADVISSVSPIWYRLSAEGEIEERTEYAQGSGVPLDQAKREVAEACRHGNIKLIPLISNAVRGKGWDPGVVLAIVNSPERRKEHIAGLVALTVENDYAGIEIDYEMLKPETRDAFSLFMEELAEALHARGKLLATAIHPKTAEPGKDWGPKAHDYARIGRVCDSIRIMAYDYHWSTGPAGPVAPLPWYREVLAHAAREIPKGKLLMGLPTYGYGWTGEKSGKSSSVEAQAMPEFTRKLGVEAARDPESNALRFTYPKGSETHHVWYEDAECLKPKVAAAREAGIAGIAVFRLGAESEGFWKVLRGLRD